MNIIITADFHLAKFDVADLAQQTLMELLVAELHDPLNVQRGDSIVQDECCTWKGVTCSMDNVVKVDWKFLFRARAGTVDLRYVPHSVTSINLFGNLLEGTLGIGELPDALIKLYATENRFYGDFHLESLPLNLEGVWAGSNKLSGSLNLTHLPVPMKWLALNENTFTGSLCLTSLPKGLLQLLLYSNQLSGEIDLTDLPINLEKLNVSKNALSGPIILCNLPQSMVQLYLQMNAFSGEIDLRPIHSSITAAIDISGNELTGTIQTKRSLQAKVNAFGNGFESIVDEKGECFGSLNVYCSYKQ